MSIITKTGDDGTTGLMYNRRVSKCHPRVEAYGAVDELNAALGLARATADDDFLRENLLMIQKNLVVLMGELATTPADLQRYLKDGYRVVEPDMTSTLEKLAKELEAQNITFDGWATPGANQTSAALDMARTICRRGERRVWALEQSGELQNLELAKYLNRASDLLWLLARWVETKALC
jgi:cob(I)alamin adenosyltransferase